MNRQGRLERLPGLVYYSLREGSGFVASLIDQIDHFGYNRVATFGEWECYTLHHPNREEAKRFK
jgi:hypothetical protein